jgi:hypothetical protein
MKQLFKHSRAFHEFNTTYAAAIKGVPVEVPIAYGEMKGVFAKESYLIIRKIKQCCTMREYFKSNTSCEERMNVLREFGKLAKNIHDSGVQQDDFSLDNFLVHSNENGERRVILIDFERVSIQRKSLSEKHRIWYLAKLNRAKRLFTNTERFRFLISYTGGDSSYCKKLANQIEALTVSIQRKDAQKFHKQCTHENRKFGIFKNANFYGHYRKQYPLETMITLLNTIDETAQDVLYRDNFQILRFGEQPRSNQKLKRGQESGSGERMSAMRNPISHLQPLTPSRARFNYDTITHTWMHANALSALGIDVLVPIGIFKRRFPRIPKEGFLISQVPDNCIPLNQYIGLYSDKNTTLFALLRLADQVSPFGMFTKNLNIRDILVQKITNRLTCYLGNHASFRINRHSIQKNRTVNKHIVKQLILTNDLCKI